MGKGRPRAVERRVSRQTLDAPDRVCLDVPSAPVYYPTEDEFKDPLEYISKIRHEAEPFGICRIVPPACWKPPFALDLSSFTFPTKTQAIHQLQARAPACDRETFDLDYNRFLEERCGRKAKRRVVFEGEDLDLCRLFNAVKRFGGYDKVVKDKKWAEVFRFFRASGKVTDCAKHVLGQLYREHLCDYEKYYNRLGKKKAKCCKRRAELTKIGDHADNFVGVKRRRKNRLSPKTGVDEEENDQICEQCKIGLHGEVMLLCDRCNKGWHIYCLSPPLKQVPPGNWYCLDCLNSSKNNFGFVPGKQLSLEDFRRVADRAKKRWLGSGPASRVHIEKKFWEIVEGSAGKVEVIYGSDLDTLEFGSGFPRANHKIPESVDSNTWNEYCAHPWNLNNLPKLKGSMLHSVHQNIAGVMVPWLYVGMLFSSFCWHFEDHCFYSMNYLHWGEPKCWYSVPGSESSAFEKVMRMSLPDLFDAQPDLLFQLITLLSPSVLKENGVSVYTVLQEPGNFVVTFPRSFHAGFNFGLNCAEAVNFAPADWIPHGSLCADLYRLYRKPAVISHEELLFVAAKSNHNTKDSRFLKNELQKLFMKEKSLRECLWKNGVVKSALMSPRRYPEYVGIEEDPPCIICRQYLFLSAISCRCRPSSFVCLEHWRHICECKPRKRRLLYRHTLAELNYLLSTLDECNLLESQSNKLLPDVLFSDDTCAVARKMEGGQTPLVELAEQWLLCSANALRNPFSEAIFQKLLKEAEQFLWAGSDMDTVRDMNRKLAEALSWAERVKNCLQQIENFSDSDGEVNRINDLEVAELLDCNPKLCHVPGVLKLKGYAEEAKKLAGEIEVALTSPIELPELEVLYSRSCNIQIYVHRQNELKLKISLVKDCLERARRYLAEKCPASIGMDSLYKLNSQIVQLQLLHPEAKLLGDLVEKTESCCSQCADLLRSPMSLEDVERFLQQLGGFTVDVPEVNLLQQYQLETLSWISRFESIWSNIYERDDHRNVADELSTLLEDGMSLKVEVRELTFVEAELKKSACRAKAVKGQAEKMSVDYLQQLLVESSSLEIQGESLFIQIADVVQAATHWEHNAVRILSTGATMSEFEEAIRLSEEIQAILPSLVNVLAACDVAKSWLNNSAPFMESSHSALHLSNSSLKVEKLKELVSESKLLNVFLGETKTLEIILLKCKEWEQEASCVLLHAESFLNTSRAALMNDGLPIKIQEMISSLDAVLNAGLSLGFDFSEIPRLQNAHSVLSWCHSVISISSSSPSVQEVELLLQIQGQILCSFKVGDLPSTLLEGLKWMKKVAEIVYASCKYENFNILDIEETLVERQMIPLLFPVMDGKLAEAMTKHRLWLEKALQFLDLEASQRSWMLLLQLQVTGKTDAFNCLELFTILSEVERVENWRHQLREVMGISSSDSNSLIDSMEKIRRKLDRSMNVYDKSRGCRMDNHCMHCSSSFKDDQFLTCSMCNDCYHEQCLGPASFSEKHGQELCSFCQLSESEFDLQIVKSHLEHQERDPSLDIFCKLAADADDLLIRIQERDPIKLLLESANSFRECLTQITDFVMESTEYDFVIVAQKLIIALKAVSVAGIHDHQRNGFLELAFRRYGWRLRAGRVVQGLQKPNMQHIHALLKEGNAVDISPDDPSWCKLIELKSIALQWSKTAKKVASDSGACGLEQVFEVIFQGENLPVNVEKQLKLLRARSILYCICRKPYDRRPMIACDQCQEWYHFACIKLHSVPKIYTCPACKPGEESYTQNPSEFEISATTRVIEPKTPCNLDRLIKEKSEAGYSEELVSSIMDEKTVFPFGETDALLWRNRKPFRRIVRKRTELSSLLVSSSLQQ